MASAFADRSSPYRADSGAERAIPSRTARRRSSRSVNFGGDRMFPDVTCHRFDVVLSICARASSRVPMVSEREPLISRYGLAAALAGAKWMTTQRPWRSLMRHQAHPGSVIGRRGTLRYRTRCAELFTDRQLVATCPPRPALDLGAADLQFDESVAHARRAREGDCRFPCRCLGTHAIAMRGHRGVRCCRDAVAMMDRRRSDRRRRLAAAANLSPRGCPRPRPRSRCTSRRARRSPRHGLAVQSESPSSPTATGIEPIAARTSRTLRVRTDCRAARLAECRIVKEDRAYRHDRARRRRLGPSRTRSHGRGNRRNNDQECYFAGSARLAPAGQPDLQVPRRLRNRQAGQDRDTSRRSS